MAVANGVGSPTTAFSGLGVEEKKSFRKSTPDFFSEHERQFERRNEEFIAMLRHEFIRFKIGNMLKLIILLMLSVSALSHATDASVCKRMNRPSADKPKVVLVHGLTTGGWYWLRVRFYLVKAGYNVTAPDLRGSGYDFTNVSEVETFERYNEPLDRFMASLPAHEKVVLVGHNTGGISVTRTIIDHPKKVAVAIYVAATMLESGFLTCQHLQIGIPGFSESKCNASCPKLPPLSCFPKVISPSIEIPLKDRTEYTEFGEIMARPGPYRAILASDFTEAIKNGSGVDKVPRVYLKTRFDRTLLPEQQRAMIELWPPCEVVELNSGHDVPFTDPETLADIIMNFTMYT